MGVLDVSVVNMIFVEKEKWSWGVHIGGNHSKRRKYDTCEKCDNLQVRYYLREHYGIHVLKELLL